MHSSLGIRLRIAVVVAVVSAIAVAVVGVATTRIVERTAEAELRQLSEASIATMENGQPVVVGSTASNASDRSGMSSEDLMPISGNSASVGLDGGSFIVVTGDTDFGGVSAPITGTGEPQFATAFTPSGGLDQAVATMTKGFWIGGPALVILLAGASWILAGRALRPVSILVEETQRISTSSPGERVPIPPGRNELSQLALTMNQMLDRIQSGTDRQRQFVSDASHELRTPLTALMGDVEIALTHPEEAPWPETAERVLQQCERLESLVQTLLEAATKAEDAGVQVEQREPVDIYRMVQSEIDLLRGSLNSVVSITLIAADQPLLVLGQPTTLASAVRNLLSNAIRHARSSVKVTVLWDNGSRVITIFDDDGPGVGTQHREMIFERFSRLDEARDADAGGSGLGLAIVQSVADSHGGRCWVEDNPDGGARFALAIPKFTGSKAEISGSNV